MRTSVYCFKSSLYQCSMQYGNNCPDFSLNRRQLPVSPFNEFMVGRKGKQAGSYNRAN